MEEDTLERWRDLAHGLLEQNEQLAAELKKWMDMYAKRDEEILRLHELVKRMMELQGIPYKD